MLFPGWENCSVHQVFCTAGVRQKAAIAQEPASPNVPEEEKSIISKDSAFRAKWSENYQKWPAFLKDVLTHCLVALVIFFYIIISLNLFLKAPSCLEGAL